MLKIRTYLLITSFLIFATNFNADEKISKRYEIIGKEDPQRIIVRKISKHYL